MNLNPKNMKYALTSRILHWVMAILIIEGFLGTEPSPYSIVT
jgi:cytochrome b561